MLFGLALEQGFLPGGMSGCSVVTNSTLCTPCVHSDSNFCKAAGSAVTNVSNSLRFVRTQLDDTNFAKVAGSVVTNAILCIPCIVN